MNWIKDLPKLDLSKNKYSQYGEEIILKNIFENIKIKHQYLVDIGAGGAGKGLSNSRYFLENDWNGLLFDMDGSGENIIKEFIKPNNIVQLLSKHKCPKEFDLLSVDIDSFDYDVIDNVLSKYTPRVVCAEFNGTLDPNKAVKLQYEDGYIWDETNKYGFSFAAGIKLFEKHGYTVVLNHKETNLFAIHKSELPKDFKINITAKQNIYHRVNTNAIFIEV